MNRRKLCSFHLTQENTEKLNCAHWCVPVILPLGVSQEGSRISKCKVSLDSTTSHCLKEPAPNKQKQKENTEEFKS